MSEYVGHPVCHAAQNIQNALTTLKDHSLPSPLQSTVCSATPVCPDSHVPNMHGGWRFKIVVDRQ